MAKILGYTVVNGGRATNYEFTEEVYNQDEIEQIRIKLEDIYNKDKAMDGYMFGEDYNPYKVYFTIKKKQNSRLHP